MLKLYARTLFPPPLNLFLEGGRCVCVCACVNDGLRKVNLSEKSNPGNKSIIHHPLLFVCVKMFHPLLTCIDASNWRLREWVSVEEEEREFWSFLFFPAKAQI